MSEASLVSDMKGVLVECPLCRKQFDETDRVPRRMPCCVEPVCDSCLFSLYSNGRISCPLCYKQHHGYRSIYDLPVDQLTLKIVALKNAKKSSNLPCTFCPKNNFAVAKCGHCGVLMCQVCSKAHSKNKLLKGHRVTTFDEIRHRRLTSGSRTLSRSHSAPSMSSNLASHIKEKAETLNCRLEELEDIYQNLAFSKKRAIADVNKLFDEMSKELHERRVSLVSEIETRAMEEMGMLGRVIDSHRELLGKMKKSSTKSKRRKSSSSSSDTWDILTAYPRDVSFSRKGISFLPCNVDHLSSLMRTTGLVRTVVYAPTEKPEGVPEAVMYNSISLDPAELPDGTYEDYGFVSHCSAESEHTCFLGDQVVAIENGHSLPSIFCPNLEWDTSTCGMTLTKSGHIITNGRPEVPLPTTGCRMKADRHVLASRPLSMQNGQRIMYQMKVSFTLKMTIRGSKMLFETALTDAPVESFWNQPAGLTMNIATCSNHKDQLCLHVVFDNKLMEDLPLVKNEVGMSRCLYFGVLLNSVKNEIQVIDVEEVKVICSIPDVDFDRPFWIMILLSYPSWASMAVAMVSGTRARITKDLNHLLATVT